MPITDSRPCLLPPGEPTGTVQQPRAQTAIQTTGLCRYVLLSIALVVSPSVGIAGDAIQTAEFSLQNNESQQTPQEQRAAERERIRAERKAKREQQRAEREAERERIKSELEAKRQAQVAEREAARQAQIQEQEQACKRLDTLRANLASVPQEVLQRRFGGGIQNPRSPALQIPYESWLLADDIFVPAFGKRYDDVAAEEGTKLQTVMRNCKSPTNAQGQAIVDSMLFFRAFDQRYQPKYLSGVQDIRKAHEGIAELARQLDALPGDATGSERWHALAEKAGNLQAFAGREQRAALQAGLRKAYTYVVLPTHARKAEQVAGQAQGLEGLRALMQLKSEFERDASLAGTAAAWPDVARSRQAAIISAISKEQHKRIDALGTGLESMERGVAWYRDYRLSFDESTITAMPQLREPMIYFEQQRNKALAAARPKLEKKIAQTGTEAELKQLVARYIPLSADTTSADGKALMTRVAARREKLHKRDVLGSAADQDAAGSKPLPKAMATGPAKPAPAPAAALTPASLKTDALNYGDDVKRIYVGDFEHVRFARNGDEIGILVGNYMSAFAEGCDAYLPKNKVEVLRQVCTRESYRTNMYGEVPGSRTCISYETVGTGKFADPEVYDLAKQTDAAMAGNLLGDWLKGMKSGGRGDLNAGLMKTTDVAVYAAQDMPKLLAENGCASAATVRFQANMLRFGEGKEPIRMPGGVGAVATPAVATGPFKDQNYKRLIDDLIAEESGAWRVNQYSKGSVTNDRVIRDSQGRPREVNAEYGYMAFGSPYKGSVRVTFEGGTPDCIYFSDFPTTCRAPNPRVISTYEKQGYAN